MIPLRATLGLLLGLPAGVGSASQGAQPATGGLAVAKFEWMDSVRGRRVPLIIYGQSSGNRRPLAIISNGYGGSNAAYGFVAKALVERGYVVASIQQDLPDDPAMPSVGNLAVLRRPAWQVGVDTIAFVIRRLNDQGIARQGRVVLVGHSNGGDISMLFAMEHPNAVAAVFSLDNRRMPLPLTTRPRICSLRSSDRPADAGVLPSTADRRRHRIQVSFAEGLPHNDMWDGATTAQRDTMRQALLRCLDA